MRKARDAPPTDLFMYLATMRSACLDHTSLIGLLPWYAGRSRGLLGRGRRSVYGSAVYDSSAWLPGNKQECVTALSRVGREFARVGNFDGWLPSIVQNRHIGVSLTCLVLVL